MRLPADGPKAAFARIAVSVALAGALAACGSSGGGASAHLPIMAAPGTGPQADYPVVVGEPYSIAGTTYTPEDVMNFDEVGYAAADPAGGSAVSGSHHTLPLPSYVEVTSLTTGRTILVRIERRGPMNGHELVALSPGAMAQLEAAPGTPVRVRRVNPPEDQRALLRAGGEAPPRMDTPMSLVEILKRKLPAPGAAEAALALGPASRPLPQVTTANSAPPAAVSQIGGPPPLPALAAPMAPPAAPRVVERPAASRPAAQGEFLVQAAAFSSSERAQNAARALGGEVTPSGRYFRVRTGPFATRSEAEASLAKVRAAGYSDARILTNG